jgi:anti-anti-sigma factor
MSRIVSTQKLRLNYWNHFPQIGNFAVLPFHSQKVCFHARLVGYLARIFSETHRYKCGFAHFAKNPQYFGHHYKFALYVWVPRKLFLLRMNTLSNNENVMANDHRSGASLQPPPTTEIELIGDVRADQAARLHAAISEINLKQQPTLHFDCAQLKSLDGAVFQLLAFWRSECVRGGGELVLNNLTPPVTELLQGSGFTNN